MAEACPENQGGVNPCGPVIPMRISDKACLEEEPVQDFHVNVGRKTWILAVLGLPTIGFLLIVILFITMSAVESLPRPGKVASSPSRKIFIVDVNENSKLQMEKLLPLETSLKAHPYSDVYLIVVNRYLNQTQNTTVYESLKSQYPNFHYTCENPSTFFDGSIYGDSYTAENSVRQLLFKAQLLTLWRYGGIILSPFWSPLQPINKNLNFKVRGNLILGMYNDRLGVLATENACNAVVFDLIKESIIMGMRSKTFESDIIDKVLVLNNKMVQKLRFPKMCSDITRTHECILMKHTNFPEHCLSDTLENNFSDETEEPLPVLIRRFLIFT